MRNIILNNGKKITSKLGIYYAMTEIANPN